MALKPHFGKSKVVRFSEPTYIANKVTIVSKTMTLFEVGGNDEMKCAIACASMVGGFPQMFLQAGRLPWTVSITPGYPPVAFPTKVVESVLQEMPIPEGLLNDYHPVCYQRKQGWLVYFSDFGGLYDTRTKYYYDGENKDPTLQEFVTWEGDGCVINETKMLDSLITKNKVIDWRQRMVSFKENSWIKSRINCWLNNYLLPPQWLSFGIGQVCHFLRYRNFFNNSDQTAWQTIWTGMVK